MSRRVQIVVLCEDQQHEAFARRFLEAMGWHRRSIDVKRGPGGGSKEQFVRTRFPKELRELRRRQVARAVIAILDGDALGLQARLRTLDDACTAEGIPPRTNDERAAVFVPTWEIETWLAYLDGENVDEGKNNYRRLRRPGDCGDHVRNLVEMCRRGRLREPAPDSLKAACEEFNARVGPR